MLRAGSLPPPEKGSVPFSCRIPRPPSNGLADSSPRHLCYLLAKLIMLCTQVRIA